MLHQPETEFDNRLRIVIAASEAVPWSKTGGLADVSTALAKSLAVLGHEVSLIVPYHRQTKFAEENSDTIHDSGLKFEIPIGSRKVSGKLFWTTLPRSDVRVFLVDQPAYFDRGGLYQDGNGEYGDNCERFVFFSRAVIEACRLLVLRPDVMHANDWQTGLIPALLEVEARGKPGFETTGSVLTIHNLLFQGWFDREAMNLTGLDWRHFNWRQMEAYGQLNLLKTGLAFADQLTTVSPTYAKEIQTAEFGCGMEGLLNHRTASLTGILNGIDPETWSPETDPSLAENFDADNFATGKPICKTDLQQRVGLPKRADVPLFGMVSRMTDQKGCDLITHIAQDVLQNDVQMAFLGSGDAGHESMFINLARRFPEKVSVKIGFDEKLAHQIEAGSDFYLMPSQFEPCGLNQMYSLSYGTVPLVRAVGGLADSVVDANSQTLADGTATGIVFEDYDAESLRFAVDRCMELYNDPTNMKKVVRSGMLRDSSWQNSAEKYLSVYRAAIALHSHVSQ